MAKYLGVKCRAECRRGNMSRGKCPEGIVQGEMSRYLQNIRIKNYRFTRKQ